VQNGADRRLNVMLTPSCDGEFYNSFMISLCQQWAPWDKRISTLQHLLDWKAYFFVCNGKSASLNNLVQAEHDVSKLLIPNPKI